jgi:predicted Fe-S protein YdhL (DUF1289 family)
MPKLQPMVWTLLPWLLCLCQGCGRSTLAVTAEEMYQDYQKNSVNADVKYRNQVVEVSGAVARAFPSTPAPNVTLDVGVPSRISSPVVPGVMCTFPPADREKLLGIQQGQRIIVRGTCEGYGGGSIVVRDCDIIRK